MSAQAAVLRGSRRDGVWVNSYEEGDLTIPFGVMKASGDGRDTSRTRGEKCTALKTTWMNLR